MAFEQRPGQGSLFRNRKKQEGDKQPNLKGTALVTVGSQLVELEIAAWTRESDKAGKWLSLSVKAKSSRPDDDMDRAMPSDDRDIDLLRRKRAGSNDPAL